jgi:hypothetical protein
MPAPHISQKISIGVSFDAGMLTRDLRIWQREVTIRTASQGKRSFVDGNDSRFAIDMDD